MHYTRMCGGAAEAPRDGCHREVLHHALVHPNVNVREYLENDPEAYSNKAELLEARPSPLSCLHRHSLRRSPWNSLQVCPRCTATPLLTLC